MCSVVLWPGSCLALWGAGAPLDSCARDRQGVPFGTSGMALFSMIGTTGGFFGRGAVGAGAGGFCPLASAPPAGGSIPHCPVVSSLTLLLEVVAVVPDVANRVITGALFGGSCSKLLHGSSRCPLGAISSGYESVPGGSCFDKS